MAVKYKQKCAKCKKNYVVVTWKQSFPICYDCQKDQLKGEISDPEMKKLLEIPEVFYKENAFLRSIKINYLQYGKLSEKQIETFKRAVEKLKLGEKSEVKNEE